MYPAAVLLLLLLLVNAYGCSIRDKYVMPTKVPK